MAEKHQDMEKTSATADPAQTGSDQENALSSSVTLDIDQTLEKKLLRKLDLRIIPLLALMKLCQYDQCLT